MVLLRHEKRFFNSPKKATHPEKSTSSTPFLMLKNYSPHLRLAASMLLVLFAPRVAQAQSPTKLIYTQQSATSAADQLKTADLTGSFPTSNTVTLASDAANFGQPNDVVFDPVNNFIYVVDNTLSTGPILRYSYNSTTNSVSNRTAIVNGTSTATYQGLALDVANNRLYFSQSSATNSLDAIKVVALTSPFSVTSLIDGQTGSFGNPKGLAFDPVNKFIYMIDQTINTGSILRFTVNTTTNTVSNRVEVVAGVGAGTTSAYGGLALDQVNDRLYFTQYRSAQPSVKNSEDALKVVSGVSGSTFTVTELLNGSSASVDFLFPQDLVLDRENNYLYLVDQIGSGGAIYRYTTTGTGQTTIVGAAANASSYGGVTLNGGFFAPVSLTSSTPADGATGVSTTTNIVLNFNRAVSKGTGNFEIRRTSDNAVIETIAVASSQVTGSGTTWTIDPSASLAPGTTYALRAASGLFTAADGGSYAGISDNTTLNFTTNATPTDITLTNSSVAENASPNTVVGTFNTTDADVGQTFSYSLVAGAGSTDNASFRLVGNQLQTNATFDYETKNSYSIRVSTTDNGAPALSFEKSFTINITNVNEFLSFNPSTSLTVCAGAPVSLTITPTGFTPTNYAWSSSPAGFSGSGASLTQFSQNAPTVSSNTTYTILVTASNGPSSVTASTTVVVNARPIATLTNNGPLISLQSSVTLTAGGGGTYAFGAGASQVSGGNTATVTTTGLFSVTVTGVTGCQATATTNVTAVPDLIPILHVQPSTQYGTTNFSVVVDVFELTPVATSGQIVVSISKDPMIVLSFNGSAGSVGGLTVQNGSWSFDATSNPDAYILSTNAAIGARSKLSFGLNGISTPGPTRGTLTVSSVITGSGVGEIMINNNSDTDKINYFSK